MTYDGILARLPDGGVVGIREVSRTGDPSVDVNIPSVPDVSKIHFGFGG